MAVKAQVSSDEQEQQAYFRGGRTSPTVFRSSSRRPERVDRFLESERASNRTDSGEIGQIPPRSSSR